MFPQHLACLIHGVDPRTFEYHKGAAEVLENYRDPAYGVLQKMAANFAANAYEAAGYAGCVEHILFDGLRKQAHWYPEFDKWTDPVLRVMTHEFGQSLDAQAEVEYQAKHAGVGSMLMGLLGRGAALAPQMTKMMLGTGAVTGAGLGAIGWGLNRDSTEDDLKTEAMRERLRHYRKITHEISQDLRRNNALDAPESPTQVIKDDAGTQNVI